MTMRKAKSSKMSTRCWISLAVITLAFSVGAFKKKSMIDDVKVEKPGDFYQVAIATNVPGQQPTINRLIDPLRIVVEFADTKLAKGLPASIDVNNGIINKITIGESKDNKAEVARVEIGLDKMMAYDLNPEANRLIIVLKPAEEAAQPSGSDMYPSSGGKVIVEGSNPANPPVTETPAMPGAELGANPSGMATATTVETAGTSAGSTVGVAPVGKVGSKLLDVLVSNPKDQTKIQFVCDATPGDFKSFEMKNPSRLVLDLYKTKLVYPGRTVMVNSQGIAKVRLGPHPDSVRMVFDAAGAKLPSYNIAREGERLVITVSQAINVTGPAQPILAAPLVEGPAMPAAPSAPVSAAEGKMTKIQSVDFKYTAQTSTVVIKTSEAAKYEKRENPQDMVFSIVLKDAKISAEQERSLDTTEFSSPINLVGSFQANPAEVNIVVNMNTWVPPDIKQEGKTIELSFANPGAVSVAPTASVPGAPTPGGEEINAPEAPVSVMPRPLISAPSYPSKSVKVETLTGTKVYTGAPIKIDAKNLDILDALRAIAEVSGLNIITSDEVHGKITLKLDNVPWDQALDLILETKGLGMVQYGSVIRVAPIKDIQREQEDAIKSIQQRNNLRPLQTRIIPLNFAKVANISPQIKSVLSDRGTVNVDARTNSIIIKDIPEKIQEVQVLIGSLDSPTQQVLIEARIVEATLGLSREIGVQWGIQYNSGPAWGNGTGLNFPNTIQTGGAVLGGLFNAASPATLNTAGSMGGAAGITMGSLTDAVSLDLLLKSLETQNKVKIISSPRIMTINNQRATITQGVTIPYPPAMNLAQGSAGGSQWQFVEAALRLEVTPHISPDGTVVLEVKASNNTPDLKVVSGGAPAIDKKEAETEIIIKDGETVVIGGIYQSTDNTTINQTPFLSKIPFIGKLFQDRFTQIGRTELLIFLTPRIIK